MMSTNVGLKSGGGCAVTMKNVVLGFWPSALSNQLLKVSTKASRWSGVTRTGAILDHWNSKNFQSPKPPFPWPMAVRKNPALAAEKEARYQEAIAAVRKGSIRHSAAIAFNLPRTTLHTRVSFTFGILRPAMKWVGVALVVRDQNGSIDLSLELRNIDRHRGFDWQDDLGYGICLYTAPDRSLG